MEGKERIWWFVFYNDQILIEKRENSYHIPLSLESPVPPNGHIVHELPSLNGYVCKTFRTDIPVETSEALMIDLRSSYDYISKLQFDMAGKAREILHWDKTTMFCPVCGTQTQLNTPISKKCPTCAFEMFPRISTAILALVSKGDEILLVQAHNFKGTFHSLVAGFLETGETLEECVAREVLEETGISINNITYFGSQPWPFPSGLMVGFFADYVSGEIKLQQEELASGAFYRKDNLPELPRKLSLARKMIDKWLEKR